MNRCGYIIHPFVNPGRLNRGSAQEVCFRCQVGDNHRDNWDFRDDLVVESDDGDTAFRIDFAEAFRETLVGSFHFNSDGFESGICFVEENMGDDGASVRGVEEFNTGHFALVRSVFYLSFDLIVALGWDAKLRSAEWGFVPFIPIF